MNKRLWWISLLAFALCLSLPAMAQTNFFSDLGPQGNVYQSSTGWTVSGPTSPPGSFTAANEFTSLASGSVSQIDLGMSYVSGFQNSTFYAALYTVNNGLPGTELWNESNLSSTQVFGGCCNLVSITGISGLTLTAGDSYFLVLGASNSGAYMVLNWNSTGATGTDLYSTNGGQTWNSNGVTTIGAFDILGSTGSSVPEPSSLLLLGSGLVGAFSTLRRRIVR